MGRLDGLTAIITGAARGQGEAEARLFVAEGAKVIMTDILAGQGAEATAAIGPAARFVRHDVSSEEGWAQVIEAALQAFGRIDILVNNAAIYRPARLEATEPAMFDDTYRVNQLGVYLGMRAVLEPMKTVGGGSIVNIASVAGFKGAANMFAYTTTKWAVRGMTKAAALELARYKIRVNAILPGVIDTPILDGNTQALTDALVRTTPMRRLGVPDEIAHAALYLASPESSFTTGADFAIDGGMSV